MTRKEKYQAKLNEVKPEHIFPCWKCKGLKLTIGGRVCPACFGTGKAVNALMQWSDIIQNTELTTYQRLRSESYDSKSFLVVGKHYCSQFGEWYFKISTVTSRTVVIGPFPTEQLAVSNRSKLIEVLRTIVEVKE